MSGHGAESGDGGHEPAQQGIVAVWQGQRPDDGRASGNDEANPKVFERLASIWTAICDRARRLVDDP